PSSSPRHTDSSFKDAAFARLTNPGVPSTRGKCRLYWAGCRYSHAAAKTIGTYSRVSGDSAKYTFGSQKLAFGVLATNRPVRPSPPLYAASTSARLSLSWPNCSLRYAAVACADMVGSKRWSKPLIVFNPNRAPVAGMNCSGPAAPERETACTRPPDSFAIKPNRIASGSPACWNAG